MNGVTVRNTRSVQCTAQHINKHMRVCACAWACACWNCTHFSLYCSEENESTSILSLFNEHWMVGSSFWSRQKNAQSFSHCCCCWSLALCFACVHFIFHYFCFSFGFSRTLFLLFLKMKKCETCTWFETITCLSVSVKMISERTFHAGIQYEYFRLFLAVLYAQNRQSVFSILLSLRLIFLRSTHELLHAFWCVCVRVWERG